MLSTEFASPLRSEVLVVYPRAFGVAPRVGNRLEKSDVDLIQSLAASNCCAFFVA